MKFHYKHILTQVAELFPTKITKPRLRAANRDTDSKFVRCLSSALSTGDRYGRCGRWCWHRCCSKMTGRWTGAPLGWRRPEVVFREPFRLAHMLSTNPRQKQKNGLFQIFAFTDLNITIIDWHIPVLQFVRLLDSRIFFT